MIEIAVQGCTVQLTWQGSGTGPPPTLAFSSITTPPSTKCKAGSKSIYRGTITVAGTATQTSDMQPVATVPVSIDISPSVITKCKADGKMCLGKGDQGISSATYVWSAPSPPAGSGLAYSGVVKAEITVAGQTKVKAN
jgi:hypothetical protein